MGGEDAFVAFEGPDVDVVDAFDARNFEQRFFDMGDVYVGGDAFHKNINSVEYIFYGADDDEAGEADGEDGVDDVPVGEIGDDAADENGDPAEDVFEEMPGNDFFVLAVAFAGTEDGEAVDDDAENREEDDAERMDFLGVEEARDGVYDDEN